VNARIACLFLCLCGCSSGGVKLEDEAVSPTLRATWWIEGDEPLDPWTSAEDGDRALQFGVGVEAWAAVTSGKDRNRQSDPGTSEVDRFLGDELRGVIYDEFLLQEYFLAGRGALHAWEQLAVSLYAGVAIDHLRVERKEKSTGTTLKGDVLTGGPQVALQIGWTPTRWLELYQLTGFRFGLHIRRSYGAAFWEVGVKISPLRHVNVFAGWREANWGQDQGGSLDDARLRLSTLTFGLGVEF
jgi:hypothetical protein